MEIKACKHNQVGGCLECASESNELAISELNDCLVSMQKREAKKSKRIKDLEAELAELKAENDELRERLCECDVMYALSEEITRAKETEQC